MTSFSPRDIVFERERVNLDQACAALAVAIMLTAWPGLHR